MTIDPELVRDASAIPTSTWSDALDQLGLTGVLTGFEFRSPERRFAGPAVTVDEQVGPYGSADPAAFGVDLVLRHAGGGDVLVIAQSGEPPASAIGGLAALSARRRGVAGIVVSGACRDAEELLDSGLPILSRSLTPASGRGRARIAGVNVPITIDGVSIAPGDLIVGDATGVVVLPADRVEELLALAVERAESDARAAAELQGAVVGDAR